MLLGGPAAGPWLAAVSRCTEAASALCFSLLCSGLPEPRSQAPVSRPSRVEAHGSLQDSVEAFLPVCASEAETWGSGQVSSALAHG